MTHGEQGQQHKSVLRPVESRGTSAGKNPVKKEATVVTGVYLVLLLFGVGTGYLLSQKGAVNPLVPKGTPVSTDTVVGVQDASTFTDCPTGKLEKGGVDGEGTHKLIRDGGPSQTAYLISSIIDLDQYVGQTVNVCGQTVAAQKVSWLMDVGRLEIK